MLERPHDGSPGPVAAAPPITHVVRVDRRRRFTSATLAPQDLDRLAAAFSEGPWWRDRWSDRKFRAVARSLLSDRDGLILLDSAVKFDPPPPFTEHFEPIEIAAGLGGQRDRLKTLSGEAPTRQESAGWIVAVLLVGIAVVPLALLVAAWLQLIPARAAIWVGALLVLTTLVPVVVLAAQRWTGRWFLVPGGVAIARRPNRRGGPGRVTVLSRADSCLIFRYISNGKTTFLCMELWTPLGKRLRRAVSEREAISVMAAWQSPLSPPRDDQLEELVGW